jgi:hypothetical protein
MILTLKLLLWLVPIALNVWADAKGRKPNYGMMFALRGFIAVTYQFFIVPPDMMPWTLSGWQLVMVWLPIMLFQTTSFWIIFELSLNIIQKRDNLLYYDIKEKDSGYIDRFFAWAGPTWHAVAKGLAFIVMVLSIAVILANYDA